MMLTPEQILSLANSVVTLLSNATDAERLRTLIREAEDATRRAQEAEASARKAMADVAPALAELEKARAEHDRNHKEWVQRDRDVREGFVLVKARHAEVDARELALDVRDQEHQRQVHLLIAKENHLNVRERELDRRAAAA